MSALQRINERARKAASRKNRRGSQKLTCLDSNVDPKHSAPLRSRLGGGLRLGERIEASHQFPEPHNDSVVSEMYVEPIFVARESAGNSQTEP